MSFTSKIVPGGSDVSIERGSLDLAAIVAVARWVECSASAVSLLIMFQTWRFDLYGQDCYPSRVAGCSSRQTEHGEGRDCLRSVKYSAHLQRYGSVLKFELNRS